MTRFPCLGFYDTSNETFDPAEPNFKRLRQQELDGELRRDKEAVSLTFSFFAGVQILEIYNHLIARNLKKNVPPTVHSFSGTIVTSRNVAAHFSLQHCFNALGIN